MKNKKPKIEFHIVSHITLNKKLTDIKKKYDPYWKIYPPHITLVSNIRGIEEKDIRAHIKKCLGKIKTMPITLRGFRASNKGNLLFISVRSNKNNIFRIYRAFCSGKLKKFKYKHAKKWIPHVTLGLLKSKKQIGSLIKYLNKQNFSQKTKIDSVSLIKVKGNLHLRENFRLTPQK